MDVFASSRLAVVGSDWPAGVSPLCPLVFLSSQSANQLRSVAVLAFTCLSSSRDHFNPNPTLGLAETIRIDFDT
jgi:hypothetical protein